MDAIQKAGFLSKDIPERGSELVPYKQKTEKVDCGKEAQES
jgi:hypothetical protein